MLINELIDRLAFLKSIYGNVNVLVRVPGSQNAEVDTAIIVEVETQSKFAFIIPHGVLPKT